MNMSEITKHVGELLRQARKKRGMTQKELGELIGVGEPTINKYEKGKVNPSLDTLNRLATAMNAKLNVSFDTE